MPDKLYIGSVKYGEVARYNSFEFVFHKRTFFAKEEEIRVALECPDILSAQNRHYDINNFPHREPLEENPIHECVHPFKRRRIDLKSLVTEIVIGPEATEQEIEEINLWNNVKGFSFPIKRSSLVPTPLPLSQ
jgi:hypothetical protein